MAQVNEPISFKERVFEIDGIRGFALLGILMMNIMTFAAPMMQQSLEGGEIEVFSSTPQNEWSIMFINTFVTTNFYTMFSFLFGLGFYIFLTRANEKGHRSTGMYLRRMLMLLFLGLMHGIFLWYGDILWTYAIAGLLLIFFYKLAPKVNLIIGIAILGIGSIFVLLMALLTLAMGDTGEAGTIPLWFDMEEVILNGGYLDTVFMNISILGMMMFQAFITVPNVLALFLIGLYAGQKAIFQNLEANRSLINKVAWVGLGFGLPIKVLSGYGETFQAGDEFWSSIGLLASTLGGPLIALGYIALFIIISRKTKGLVKLLQPVGQMALTNYILQTVIMVVIFYGFNLFNQVDAVWFIPIVLLVFTVQVIISHLWMSVFKYGPLEWLWRSFTYLQFISIKR